MINFNQRELTTFIKKKKHILKKKLKTIIKLDTMINKQKSSFN